VQNSVAALNVKIIQFEYKTTNLDKSSVSLKPSVRQTECANTGETIGRRKQVSYKKIINNSLFGFALLIVAFAGKVQAQDKGSIVSF